MSRFLTISGPPIVAVFAAFVMPLSAWVDARQGLLIALSVVAAGVLVRLARGISFVNPDHFQLDEIRKLSKAIKFINRSLFALMVVSLCAMLSLVAIPPVVSLLVEGAMKEHELYIQSIFSGFLGYIVSFVFFRMLQVVESDLDLTQLQADTYERVVQRKQANEFAQLETKSALKPYRQPEDYGRVIS